MTWPCGVFVGCEFFAPGLESSELGVEVVDALAAGPEGRHAV
jgi:hypothetical protein